MQIEFKLKLKIWLWKEEIYRGQTPQNLKLKIFLQKSRKTSTPLGCARFAENLSELTKTWSSGATECGVWIGNCNVKVWKSTEHKLHKIWRSVQFQQNEHTPGSREKLQNLLELKYSEHFHILCLKFIAWAIAVGNSLIYLFECDIITSKGNYYKP